MASNHRAYCLGNIHHADVDPASISMDILDEALLIARTNGVYSLKAEVLLNTVRFK